MAAMLGCRTTLSDCAMPSLLGVLHVQTCSEGTKTLRLHQGQPQCRHPASFAARTAQEHAVGLWAQVLYLSLNNGSHQFPQPRPQTRTASLRDPVTEPSPPSACLPASCRPKNMPWTAHGKLLCAHGKWRFKGSSTLHFLKVQ